MTSISTRSRRATRSCASDRAARLAAACRSRTRRRTRRRSRGCLADVDPRDDHDSRDALAQLPVTRKSELARAAGGSAPVRRTRGDAVGCGDLPACSRRPGRIYEPEGRAPDYWRLARALFAAGFRRGDLVHNCFSYHLTPAGFDARKRRARARLHGLPGGNRPDRAAGAGDGRPAARRLRRHAVVPARSSSRRPTSWASRSRR